MGPGSAEQRYRTMLRIAYAAPRPGQENYCSRNFPEAICGRPVIGQL
jgi:hypothetical protein